MSNSGDVMMKSVPDLDLGYSDAENYKRSDSKELFNRIFIRTSALDQLVQPNICFLIGEKGTGKTAHAVYLSNNPHSGGNADTWSSIAYIRETEYQKFVKMKAEKHLELADYTSIWKVIIYLLIAQRIRKDEPSTLANYFKFDALQNAIDEFYMHAFAPEIQYAITFVEDAKASAELLSLYANVWGAETQQISFTETRFQTNLLYIQRKFEDALDSLRLKRSHVLFIDGIDIRPSSIPYEQYLECVKGLANAIWSINNDFFANIKDSRGRMRAVLLVRPDIYDSIGLQNSNNKIRDNSVLLDWRTPYSEYRTSELFALTDKLLSSQQSTKLPKGIAWDYYFPYKTMNRWTREGGDAAYIDFLRLSMYRPRDIITMLRILQENFVKNDRGKQETFREEDLRSPEFMRKYSDYMLGEVKDQLSFYHTSEHYELFLKFFEYLNGKVNFYYSDYLEAFGHFERFLDKNSLSKPKFFETADIFLQFLYELNVLCYNEDTVDGKVFIRWCFWERSSTNLSPKVKTHLRYTIHYGLAKALNSGKTLVSALQHS